MADRILAALTAPVRVGEREVTVGTSIGIATARPGGDADELLRDADAAMYAAKVAGRGRWARFDAEMHRRAMERLDLETDPAHAVARGQLEVVYQPLCELATGRAYGAEALLRWHHPRRGLVPPGEFIPVAEETGLIGPIGRWVLGAACAQMHAWNARRAPGDPPLRVNVNVSGRQLDDAGFVDDVRAALAASGLEASCLTLEITESAIMHDVETTLERLHALKACGWRLAVDDFGTGYSSLAYLQRFPVDVLKIDKSFVDAVAHAQGAASLVRTIVALDTSMQLSLVAEGIEHAEQRAALRALGCPAGQGYLLARPASAASVEALLLPAPAAAGG